MDRFPIAFVTLIGVLAWPGLVSADAPKIRAVELRAVDEDYFQRLPEFVTGREFSGRRIIRRTSPESRGGLYFVATGNWRGMGKEADYFAEVSWIDDADIEMRTERFRIPGSERRRGRALFLGLTGKEAPPLRARPDIPVWRLRLLDHEGAVLAEETSWLWSERDNPAGLANE